MDHSIEIELILFVYETNEIEFHCQGSVKKASQGFTSGLAGRVIQDRDDKTRQTKQNQGD